MQLLRDVVAKGGAAMKNGEFPEELILVVLEQAETGVPLAELCRQLDVTEKTFYGWKSKYDFAEERMPWALEQAKNGVSVAELCRQLDVTEKAFHHWEAEYGSHEPTLECVDIFSVVQQSLKQLESYYTINKDQARRSFAFAVAIVILGIAIIGIALGYDYRQHKSAATFASITGLLVEFIGAAYAYIYGKSLGQVTYFYDNLIEMQNTMVALKVCGELKNEARQDAAKGQLIGKLLVPSKHRGGEIGKPPDAPSRPKAGGKGSPPSPMD
jgi:transposase-like protein